MLNVQLMFLHNDRLVSKAEFWFLEPQREQIVDSWSFINDIHYTGCKITEFDLEMETG